MKTLSKTLLIALAATPAAFAAGTGTTLLISKSSLGLAGNDQSQTAAVSTGGRAVAFASEATNFVAGDGNLSQDIFLVAAKKTQRVSVNSLGFEATDDSTWNFNDGNQADSWAPMISAGGSSVVFASRATNLDLETPTGLITNVTDPNYNVSQDTNLVDDIYLRDIVKKKTYRISGKMNDCTDTPKTCTKPGAMNITNPTDGDSENPAISGDGRIVVYTTDTAADDIAHNTQVADASNKKDVFLFDTKTHRTELVSGLHDGTSGDVTALASTGDSDFGAVSPDGRLVVFTSRASTNLVPNDVNDTSGSPNGDADVFAYDRLKHTMIRISGHVNANNGSVDAEANGESFSNRFSVAGTKGRYFVAFQSKATNLDTVSDAGADDDIFVADIQTADKKTNQLKIAEIRRVSGKVDAATGLVTQEANARSRNPAIAATGIAYTVAFESDAYDMLTPLYAWQEDSNDDQDVYVYDSKAKQITRASLDLEGFEPLSDSSHPAISSDGRSVVFDTTDPYMVLVDANRTTRDIFLRRR